MEFCFKRSDRSVEGAARRVAQELASDALATLKSDDIPLDIAVHEARKTVKKIRAVLRLVRGDMKSAGQDMGLLRHAAAAVSPLRAAAVRLATLDRLAATLPDGPDGLEPLRRPLEAADRAARDPKALARALSGYSAHIRDIRRRSTGWTLAHKGFGAIEPGIRQTWDRARAALATARDPAEIEALHELRKRIKDHWYQARLLVRMNPAGLTPHAERIGALGEALGSIHDIDDLLSCLGAEAPADRLVSAARDQRADLYARALPEAEAILGTNTDDLAAGWRAAWKAWRA
ncbi:MAG: hypothetical protein RLZZ528_1052 [Pseudomonadota bacterium]